MTIWRKGVSLCVVFLFGCGPERAVDRSLSVTPAVVEVVAGRLGEVQTVIVEVSNHAVVAHTVDVGHVSCGCLRALDASVAVPAGATRTIRVEATVSKLNQEEHRMDLRCRDSGQVCDVRFLVSAVAGVHVVPGAVNLGKQTVGKAVRVGELFAALPVGTQGSGPHCQVEPDRGVFEVVLDNPRLRRERMGIGVYAYDVFVVGCRPAPATMYSCFFDAPPGSSGASLALVAGFEDK